FADPAGFRPSKCLVVVPSEALQRYVSGVLPALGVSGVPVVTFQGWARTLRKRLVPTAPDRYADETPPSVARLKKHPAMLQLLERAVADEVEAVRARLPPEAQASWSELAARAPAARLRGVRARVEKGQVPLDAATAHTVERDLRRAGRR